MSNELLDVVTTIGQVLTRVKVRRLLMEVLADACRHRKTQIGIDVDLADSRLCSTAELILGNADRIRHVTAVLVDDLDVLRNNRGRTMEHDGESRDTLLDLLKNIKAERGRYKNAVRIARALLRRKLKCAVRRADRDSEGVNTRLLDKVLYFLRLRVGSIFCRDIDIVFDTCQLTKLRLDHNAVCMCILGNALSKCHVFCVGEMRAVNHDGGETAIDARLADVKICAVVEVKCDGNIVDFECCLDEMDEVLMTGVLACTCGDLQNQRRLQLSGGIRNPLDNLHVVDVESTDGISAVVGFLKHFFCSDEWHVITP